MTPPPPPPPRDPDRWLEDLPVLTDDAAPQPPEAPAVFPGAAAEIRRAELRLDRGRRLKRSGIQGRTYLDKKRAQDCLEDLVELPRPDQQIHLVSSGNYNGWDIVRAVVALAKRPAKQTTIATLGFNIKNAEDLVRMIDAGQLREVLFIYSTFHKAHERGGSDWLAEQLRDRGQRIVCCRSHAKILCLEFSRRMSIVVESSANLQSCHNAEQSTISNSWELARFHRGWMDDLYAQGDLV
jgi:hypothetical protein